MLYICHCSLLHIIHHTEQLLTFYYEKTHIQTEHSKNIHEIVMKTLKQIYYWHLIRWNKLRP